MSAKPPQKAIANEGVMKVRYLICGLLLLGAPRSVMSGEQRLTMKVTPLMAMAPANLIVTTRIEANGANRWIEIIAESGEFYRSSEIQLDGEQAPRSSRFEFRGLPGGEYMVTAVLKSTSGVLALTRQEMHVVESPLAR
jgi:hypothetical protein